MLLMSSLDQLRQPPVGSLGTIERWQTHVLEDVSHLDRNIVALYEFLNERGSEQPAQEVGWLGFLELNEKNLVVRDVWALAQQRDFACSRYRGCEGP